MKLKHKNTPLLLLLLFLLVPEISFQMELELGLGLPNSGQMSDLDSQDDPCGRRSSNDNQSQNPPSFNYWRRRDKYVKVKMEGVGIGRKVNLSLHQSYHDLFQTLDQMFPSQQVGKHCHHHHAVTYEDGEGDWLLVGDVPWGEFIQSVKRLKILR